MSYRNLQIWKLASELSVDIHRLTIKQLPKFEMYETGSQIRRSIKSVRSNIVEGYGRRRYKIEFIRFLVYTEASCDETTDHLETLFETSSLTDKILYKQLHQKLRILGRQIHQFLNSVDESHQSVRENDDIYE